MLGRIPLTWFFVDVLQECFQNLTDLLSTTWSMVDARYPFLIQPRQEILFGIYFKDWHEEPILGYRDVLRNSHVLTRTPKTSNHVFTTLRRDSAPRTLPIAWFFCWCYARMLSKLNWSIIDQIKHNNCKVSIRNSIKTKDLIKLIIVAITLIR